MKKIIFLFCLMVMMVPSQASASDEISCDGVTFDIDRWNGETTITKRGENPFMKVYQYEGYSVSLRGVSCERDVYTFYGYAHGNDDINYYNGFVLVMDDDGEVLFEDIIDYGGNEESTGAVWIDQVLFLIMRVDDLGDRYNDIDPEFDYFVIKTYDSNFAEIDSLQLDEYILRYDSSDDLLLLYYTYQGKVDIGLDTTLKHYTSEDIFDIKDSYVGEMSISFINNGRLNGQKVENGFHIDYPGVYNFEYNYKEYSFVVHPTVEGVSHLGTYSHEVTPIISQGNLILNGESYISGTTISAPGNYTLIIKGINGYEQTIQFAITPNVDGVINGHAYHEPFIITFQGEGYLNNSLVSSPLQIEENGDYILRINGVGGLSDAYEFSMNEETSGITAQDVIQKIDVFIIVISVITGVIMIKKK